MQRVNGDSYSSMRVLQYFVLGPRCRLKECGAVFGRIAWPSRRDQGRI